MHVLGHYGKENAAAIFELFLECMPEYPLDKPDNEGNTGTEVTVNSIHTISTGIVYILYSIQYQWYTIMNVTCILLQFCSWPT